VWGVIVSDEPLLPRVEWEPGAKVESYMNASDAVVALCTPDDTLADGTVQTRPNITSVVGHGLGGELGHRCIHRHAGDDACGGG
jgi:hypothetical protein